jgi:hypothetical protein
LNATGVQFADELQAIVSVAAFSTISTEFAGIENVPIVPAVFAIVTVIAVEVCILTRLEFATLFADVTATISPKGLMIIF